MIQLGAIILALVLLAPGCNKTEKPEDLPDNPNTGNKVLVWSDEFDYNGLPDSKKWSYDTDGNSGGWGNNELQYYTASRLKNAEVKDGHLYITAHKEDFEGFKYTSARLVTRQKGDWLYGRVEVKAKIPDGRGMWPAIWMLPTDWQYGGWPASGEIDIMESVGYDPTRSLAPCTPRPIITQSELRRGQLQRFRHVTVIFTCTHWNGSWQKSGFTWMTCSISPSGMKEPGTKPGLLTNGSIYF